MLGEDRVNEIFGPELFVSGSTKEEKNNKLITDFYEHEIEEYPFFSAGYDGEGGSRSA